MSKFGLISDLDENTKSTKQKFQLFEVEIGFEHAQIILPFDNADAFVAEALNKKPKSISSLKKIAAKFGGELQ